jgi:hypothetical protein
MPVRDPAKVCGNIWFNGTEEQRKSMGKGTEGRGRDEHPPKAWWDECINKVSASIEKEDTAVFDGIQGNYTATKNKDGKWTIQDVPIFAEVSDANSQIGKKVSAKILQKLVDRAQMRAKENYYPPLHINHHGENKEVIQVGFFLPKSVDIMTYEGKETSVILADLINIEDSAYQLIKQAKFPYRSVELYGLDNDEAEITSLALLEHETPFFRLPLLTIQKEIDESEKQISLSEDSKLVRAYQGIDNKRCRMLFSLGGINMPEEKKEEKKEENMAKDEQPVKEFQEMTSDEKLDAIYNMLVTLVKKEEPEKTEEPEEQEEAGPVEMSAGKPNEKGAIFKLQGKITVLEGKISTMEKDKETQGLINEAKKELIKFNLTNIDEKLQTVAKQGKDAMKCFIAGIKETAVIDPEENFDRFSSDSKIDDKDLMEFSSKGPEVYAKALEGARQYDLIKGSAPHLVRKTFIQKFIDGSGNSGKEAVVEAL